MAKIISTDVHFDRPDQIRLAVFTETHRDKYCHNLYYSSVEDMNTRAETDVQEIVRLAQLCADVQDELDKPVHRQGKKSSGFKVDPADRRAFIDTRGGSKPVIRLSIIDNIEDTDDTDFNHDLHDGERRFSFCRLGCIYDATDAVKVGVYMQRHQASLNDHLDKLEIKKNLKIKYGKKRA